MSLDHAASGTEIDARKQEEVDFHNQREVDRRRLGDADFHKRYPNLKWYAVNKSSHQFLNTWLEQHCQGKRALDYCCGRGEMSLRMAQCGATVQGIDISDESVNIATRLLERSGLANQAQFQVMDAEHLTFPDNSFDIIICCGVLHHLDLDYAYPELARVLAPGGKILCIEALGHNPVINWYRRRTLHLRTAWEVDHILKMKDIKYAQSFFKEVDTHFFHLFAIAATPFRRTAIFSALLAACNALDRVILSVPLVRRMAWQIIFELSDPKSGKP